MSNDNLDMNLLDFDGFEALTPPLGASMADSDMASASNPAVPSNGVRGMQVRQGCTILSAIVAPEYKAECQVLLIKRLDACLKAPARAREPDEVSSGVCQGLWARV